MKRVAYIGETTGDNLQVAPQQLLDMAGRAIAEETDRPPVVGVLITVVRESPDGTLHLDGFRCGLPKFVECAVVARNYFRTVGVAIAEDG